MYRLRLPKRRVVRALSAGLALAFVAAGSTHASAIDVGVHDFAFSPSTVTAAVGETVTWSNSGSSAHTATSDGGFFATGGISPGVSKDAELISAGRFPFHCSIHMTMRGTVRVPVGVAPSGPVAVGTRIRITYASEEAPGRTYELERRRGKGDWIAMGRHLHGTVLRFTPHRTGLFSFRARVSEAGVTSAWSPAASVRLRRP